jgi:hypothetical protein
MNKMSQIKIEGTIPTDVPGNVYKENDTYTFVPHTVNVPCDHITISHTYHVIANKEESSNAFLFTNIDDVFIESVMINPSTFSVDLFVLIRNDGIVLRYVCPTDYAPVEIMDLYKESFDER